MRASREKGALLGIVIVLLGVVLAASVFAYWGLRSDSGSASNDRLEKQLFDCAEQGLAYGKQYFSVTQGPASWSSFLTSQSSVCSTAVSQNNTKLPCDNSSPAGPFTSSTTAPCGQSTAPTGYPIVSGQNGVPAVTLAYGNANISLEYMVAIYNNPGDSGGTCSDADNTVVVWSRCRETSTNQYRVVQAVINATTTTTNDYRMQAGSGMENQGNRNY